MQLRKELKMRNINELFKIINVQPKDVAIYELALTHSSFNADANTKHNDNEKGTDNNDIAADTPDGCRGSRTEAPPHPTWNGTGGYYKAQQCS